MSWGLMEGSCGGSCRWFLRWVLPMVLADGSCGGSCRWFLPMVLIEWFFYWNIENLRYIFLYNILYDNFIRFSIKLYKNPFPKSHKGIMLNTLLYLFSLNGFFIGILRTYAIFSLQYFFMTIL